MTTSTAAQKEAGIHPRQAEVIRNTAETQITVSVNLDGTGQARLATG
ncbi:MAG TPA: imidazoleglycerol-phosphate dehydratase, partial [Ramlibacter sp.]|nr:imidazoleglycerol-phosphate dehydratase [Ramlibacter sp.]